MGTRDNGLLMSADLSLLIQSRDEKRSENKQNIDEKNAVFCRSRKFKAIHHTLVVEVEPQFQVFFATTMESKSNKILILHTDHHLTLAKVAR